MDHARTEPEQSYMYMKIINILDKFINQQSEIPVQKSNNYVHLHTTIVYNAFLYWWAWYIIDALKTHTHM